MQIQILMQIQIYRLKSCFFIWWNWVDLLSSNGGCLYELSDNPVGDPSEFVFRLEVIKKTLESTDQSTPPTNSVP